MLKIVEVFQNEKLRSNFFQTKWNIPINMSSILHVTNYNEYNFKSTF